MDASGTGNLIRDNRDRKSPVQGFYPSRFCLDQLPTGIAGLLGVVDAGAISWRFYWNDS